MGEISAGYLVLAGFLVLVNAFFVAVEFSLVSLRSTKVDELVNAGRRGALRVKKMVGNLNEYLSACQVGITVASLGLGWVGEKTFAILFYNLLALMISNEENLEFASHAVAIPLAIASMTAIHVVIGEQVPKMIAIQFPETMALWTSWPMRMVNRIMYPMVWALNGATNAIIRTMGLKVSGGHHRVHSEEELGLILDESHRAGVVSTDARKMLERVFQFHDKTVREIMIPRPDVTAIDVRAGEAEMKKVVSEAGYSRIPVYDGNIDKIVGVLYVKDLIYALAHPNLIRLADVMRPAMDVPETSAVSHLLREFQKRRQHLAVVVDEFGATAGIVTLEDIVEEIVGEIRDEHDVEPEDVEKQADGTYIFEGKANLDRFAEAFPDAVLPEGGGFETVGGLVLHLAGRVPREGDSVKLGELFLRVVKRDGRRIRRVAVKRLAAGTPGSSGSTPSTTGTTIMPSLNSSESQRSSGTPSSESQSKPAIPPTTIAPAVPPATQAEISTKRTQAQAEK